MDGSTTTADGPAHGSTAATGAPASERIEQALHRTERQGVLYLPQSKAEAAALRRRVGAGEVVEPYPRLFARTACWAGLSPQARVLFAARGIGLQHPHWVFCGSTAAAVWGLWVANSLLASIHVALPGEPHYAKKPGFTFHALGCHEVVRTAGVQVTTLEETVLSCACSVDFAPALAIADSALRFYGLSREGLMAYAERVGAGRRGIIGARRVLACADGRAESGGESIARALMIELGFELPQLQVELELPGGMGTVRVDFFWQLPDGSAVIGELDGKRKYAHDAARARKSALDALVEERQRESRISLLRVPVVRFTYDDLRDPPGFARLLDAFGVSRCGPPRTNGPPRTRS